MHQIPIEVSARHIHITQKDLEVLFGSGYRLTKLRDLSQPGAFAAQECVTLQNGDNKIENVRIVGPCRSYSQVELCLTDALTLALKNVPIRKSGDLKGTPGLLLIGPKGRVFLEKGVIIPWRHLHISEKKAQALGLKHGQIVKIQVLGPRALIFGNVLVRVSPHFKLTLHLDTDEGNACGLVKKGRGTLLI